jgi:hypothetical protein
VKEDRVNEVDKIKIVQTAQKNGYNWLQKGEKLCKLHKVQGAFHTLSLSLSLSKTSGESGGGIESEVM